jgi:diguanylate cyclase (GGDEF)-like protein
VGPADEILLEESRTRAALPLAGRDRVVSATSGLAFAALALALAVLLPWNRDLSPALALSLVLGYALASRIEFEVGTGSAVPTELVLVPMLFLLPTPIVPLLVAAGYLVGAAPDYARRRVHVQRSLVLLGSSWHAVGPTLVLCGLGVTTPRLAGWPTYVLALGAQFAFDLVSSALRERLSFGISIRSLLPFFGWVFSVDAMLAPAGLLAAIAASTSAYVFVLLAPVAGLLALVARDRRRRIERAVAYSQAYRGAAEDARRDALTGLANRLAWNEAVELAEARRRELGQPTTVVTLDADRLKLINDTSGHVVGDAMLRAIAESLRGAVREGDLVARVGGDEFCVLLVDADEEAGARLSRRIADAIERHPDVEGHAVAAALGAATSSATASVHDALAAADRAMYARKGRSSRNLFAVPGPTAAGQAITVDTAVPARA